jgi:hypothetical protein
MFKTLILTSYLREHAEQLYYLLIASLPGRIVNFLIIYYLDKTVFQFLKIIIKE